MLTLPLESWGVRWIEALVTLSASTLKEWPITRMVALLRGHASVRLSVSQGRMAYRETLIHCPKFDFQT